MVVNLRAQAIQRALLSLRDSLALTERVFQPNGVSCQGNSASGHTSSILVADCLDME